MLMKQKIEKARGQSVSGKKKLIFQDWDASSKLGKRDEQVSFT